MFRFSFYKMYRTILISFLIWKSVNCAAYTEAEAHAYLKRLNKLTAKKCNEVAEAEWAYQNDLTDEHFQQKLKVSIDAANFTKSQWLETIKFPWRTFKNEDIKRQFREYSMLGAAALSDEKFEAYEKIITEMTSIFAKAKICDYHDAKKCNLSLEPELSEIMAKSRDEEELRHVWTEWRNKTGEPIRSLFTCYVALSNDAARLNNFTDTADYWLYIYETEDFKAQIAELWREIRPLYLQIHAYVRRRLRKKYGEKIVSKKGPIPAHLLGNMWAQSWSNIDNMVTPFPFVRSGNVTPHLIEKKYNPARMFRLADDFFKSVNLLEVPSTFWEKSILEKIPNREMVCHASAWDFGNGKDFRIRQCTRVTEEDLNTAHHEMGHIQYFMQYKHLPIVYRGAANPGFHEAIGDVIGLSVSTPTHMHKIGLLPNYTQTKEAELNYLFSMALDKVVFLPFGYLMDLWRWNVFKFIAPDRYYNKEWWRLRVAYQGVEPPCDRSEDDFDPASKYHIVASVPYIRYFVSFVIQFQFHEALCKLADQYDPENGTKPLHRCDIYQNIVAGNRLSCMLKLGSSKPWPDAMEILTGQRKMDAKPLLRYFAPIHQWLKDENRRTGEYIGWEDSKKRF